jgi:hypothetical protein
VMCQAAVKGLKRSGIEEKNPKITIFGQLHNVCVHDLSASATFTTSGTKLCALPPLANNAAVLRKNRAVPREFFNIPFDF